MKVLEQSAIEQFEIFGTYGIIDMTETVTNVKRFLCDICPFWRYLNSERSQLENKPEVR